MESRPARKECWPAGELSAEALLQAMSEAVYVVDRERIITYWNPAAEHLTGYSAADVIGRSCRDGILNHVDENGILQCNSACPLSATMKDRTPREATMFLHHHDGARIPVSVRSAALLNSDGSICGAVEVFHDDSRLVTLTDLLSDAQRAASTDALTGLGNRRMIDEVLHVRHDRFSRLGEGYAVLFIDVDHFKSINDKHGHDIGDRVLSMVATTLRDCSRATDAVGRWGGEEFVYVVPVSGPEHAVALGERARKLVASTWVKIDDRRISVTISVGVAVIRAGESIEHLIDRADQAVYSAKMTGRDRTVLSR